MYAYVLSWYGAGTLPLSYRQCGTVLILVQCWHSPDTVHILHLSCPGGVLAVCSCCTGSWLLVLHWYWYHAVAVLKRQRCSFNLLVLYLCSTCALLVRYLYTTGTLLELYLYRTCTVLVLYLRLYLRLCLRLYLRLYLRQYLYCTCAAPSVSWCFAGALPALHFHNAP